MITALTSYGGYTVSDYWLVVGVLVAAVLGLIGSMVRARAGRKRKP